MLTTRQDVQAELDVIPETEPVFLLRGLDPLAAETVRHYARLVREHGSDPAVADAADAHAEVLQAYLPRVE